MFEHIWGTSNVILALLPFKVGELYNDNLTFVGNFVEVVIGASVFDPELCLLSTVGGGRGDNGGSGEAGHPAFALHGRDIWHAATLSLTQQIVGPLRARADLRFALHVPGGFSPVRHHHTDRYCNRPLA